MPLTGKYYIVTGANEGIGYEVARILCAKKAHVTLACRNAEKMKKAMESIKNESPEASLTGLILDLAELASVEQFVKQYESLNIPLHCLILNAAVNMPPFQTTKDGFELTFQVNYLGHTYLSLLFLTKLKASAPSRIVAVSSVNYKFSRLFSKNDVNLAKLSPDVSERYWPFFAYNDSKFCISLFAEKLNSLLCDKFGVTVHSLHPGNLVYTKLTRYSSVMKLIYGLTWPFTETATSAAEFVIFVANSDDCVLNDRSGRYWSKGWFGRKSSIFGYKEVSEALWDLTMDCLQERRGFCTSDI